MIRIPHTSRRLGQLLSELGRFHHAEGIQQRDRIHLLQAFRMERGTLIAYELRWEAGERGVERVAYFSRERSLVWDMVAD